MVADGAALEVMLEVTLVVDAWTELEKELDTRLLLDASADDG